MVKLLSDEFLATYPDFPAHMNALGTFVELRTYSRYIADERRRETWKETIHRSVEYNLGLWIKHAKKINIPVDLTLVCQEAEELFDAEFNLKQSLSGRTKWVGGAESGIAETYPMANFNCAYTGIEQFSDMGDLFYLLMVGSGVGFKSSLEMAAAMKPVRTDLEVEHMRYTGKLLHLEDTVLRWKDEHTAMISIGDSKEGWVDALRVFMDIHTDPQYAHVTKVRMDYRHIREEGARLKRFGGKSSGPKPLMDMFAGIENVFKNRIDTTLEPLAHVFTDEPTGATYGQLRPIHILDIGNLIGNNVVVGGVRRTSELFLLDQMDYESLWAKYGVNGLWSESDFQKHEALRAYCIEHEIAMPKWFDDLGVRSYDETVNVDFVTKEPRRESDGSLSPYNVGTGFYHRAMSNNSIGFIDKPSKKFLAFVFELMKTTGEPGFINLYEAARRRLARMGIYDPKIIREYAKRIGVNPCAEIILDSKATCNLTTVNAKAFVFQVGETHVLDYHALIAAQKRSARAGLRMTLVELELPEWSAVQQRDRLIGPSITMWKDMIELCGYDEEQEAELLRNMATAIRAEVARYAGELRIPVPLLSMTIKPEGTLTQCFGGGSPGLHYAHSEFFIRRVRINATDALAKAAQQHAGWTINAENGTPGATREERLANARTIVVDFPVYSGTKKTKDTITVAEQFATYFRFQDNYTDHNSSNTITLREHEWGEALDIVYRNWDNFVGVSFLAHDGGTYQLPPYEAITKEQYEKIVQEMQPFDMSILAALETGEESDAEDGDCKDGLCGIR